MQKEYTDKLKELLLKLKNIDSFGFITIYESFDLLSKNRWKLKTYCQVYRDEHTSEYIFEAESHYNNERINPDLNISFQELGFTLKKNENYSKIITLNSEKDIENIISEVELIFDQFYEADKLNPYEIDLEIPISNAEFSPQLNPQFNKKPKTFKSNKINLNKYFKASPKTWAIIIVGIIFCYFIFFNNNEKINLDIVRNNELNSSVYQVTNFLKHDYLNDPDSYEPISWSEVIRINDIDKVGVPTYQVRHTFRAKNGFGGYVVEYKVFKLDYKGNVVYITPD